MTLEELRDICPSAKIGRLALFVEPLNDAMAEYDIDGPERQSAFLAQIAHESGAFTFLKELWGPTEQQKRYEPPNQKAADLGNTEPGDGYRYRGRGCIQITGRANYHACGLALGLDLVASPELLEQPIYACRSAAWFWQSHDLNEWADKGEFQKITRIINGGLNGWKDRVGYFERAKAVLA